MLRLAIVLQLLTAMLLGLANVGTAAAVVCAGEPVMMSQCCCGGCGCNVEESPQLPSPEPIVVASQRVELAPPPVLPGWLSRDEVATWPTPPSVVLPAPTAKQSAAILCVWTT